VPFLLISSELQWGQFMMRLCKEKRAYKMDFYAKRWEASKIPGFPKITTSTLVVA
jgi:hypothetical protein